MEKNEWTKREKQLAVLSGALAIGFGAMLWFALSPRKVYVRFPAHQFPYARVETRNYADKTIDEKHAEFTPDGWANVEIKLPLIPFGKASIIASEVQMIKNR